MKNPVKFKLHTKQKGKTVRFFGPKQVYTQRHINGNIIMDELG